MPKCAMSECGNALAAYVPGTQPVPHHSHRSVLSPLQPASAGLAPRGLIPHEGLKPLKGPARWAQASPAAPGKENSLARGALGPCGNPEKAPQASPRACPDVRAGLPLPSSLPRRSRFGTGGACSAVHPNPAEAVAPRQHHGL